MVGTGKQQAQASFKDRVTQFWQWYPTVADRFFQTIEAGQCGALTNEVGDAAVQTLPTLAWVFGPGEGGGHSFTVSGEGQVPKQLLAEYWHARAPEIANWTFHASRQPATPENISGMAIAVGEHDSIDTENFLLKTEVDDESQLIHIVAWHPTLAKLPEEHHYQILFILLDEALGEFGTQTWLGNIEFQPLTPGEGIRTIATLPQFIRQVEEYHGWEKLPPLRAYSVYELSEQGPFPRGDTLVGSTCIPDVIFEFIEGEGRLREDPLAGTGAEFAYAAIDGSVIPDGKQSDVRGNIEDAIDDALQNQQSGRTLGGAFGLNESYIDLLLLDGDNSRQIVEQALAELQLSGRSRVEAFG